MLVQELTPMTPEQQQRIFAADGEMMEFKDGWGASLYKSKRYKKMAGKVREAHLKRGKKLRESILSKFEIGRPYRHTEIHELSGVYKNDHTTRNTLNRLVKEGYLESIKIDKRAHFIRHA